MSVRTLVFLSLVCGHRLGDEFRVQVFCLCLHARTRMRVKARGQTMTNVNRGNDNSSSSSRPLRARLAYKRARRTRTQFHVFFSFLMIVGSVPLGVFDCEPTWRCHQNPFIGALGIINLLSFASHKSRLDRSLADSRHDVKDT